MTQLLKRNANWLIPICIAIILTPFTPKLDLFIAHLAFRDLGHDPSRQVLGFASTKFHDIIYLYGVIPAQITSICAALCLIFSKFYPKLKPYRPLAWVLGLNMLIGSGLITHSLLKEFWGRPRPRQIEQFGGHSKFRPYYTPKFGKTQEPARSFPSGHSTMGFYFFCLYFLGRRYHKKWLSYTGLGISFILGGLLSWARIVQGGHFISDVLIAMLIMWLTAVFVDWLIFDVIYAKQPEACPSISQCGSLHQKADNADNIEDTPLSV